MSKTKQQCGIIMPISTIDGCHESHWSEVLSILKEVIESSGLKGDVVSYADEVGIIQKRIIDNLYHNPIVICDVSGKNPNVMFELGMRLAFDKPTIIIKDDCTSYSFDTSPIEHLEYPRDLNYIKINAFKERLAVKIKAQLDAVSKDGAYSPFLKHFGEFIVAKLDQKEVSGQDYIVGKLEEISKRINSLESKSFSIINCSDALHDRDWFRYPILRMELDNTSSLEMLEFIKRKTKIPGIMIKFDSDTSNSINDLLIFSRNKISASNLKNIISDILQGIREAEAT